MGKTSRVINENIIKGVNKKIIEVNGDDTLPFEKAIFILKPCNNELKAMQSREISRYLCNLTKTLSEDYEGQYSTIPSIMKKKKSKERKNIFLIIKKYL